MNVFIADGWLRDAVFRRTPVERHEVVELDVIVKEECGDDDHRVKMWLRDEALIERVREFLTKGRIVLVRASVATEPVKDRHGAVVGDHLVFTVRELKIPHRAKAKEERETPEERENASSPEVAA